MYKLLDRIDKMIPLSTLLKRYLNKEIITNEETKDSNQIIFVVGTKGYNAKIYLYDKEDDKTWTKRLSVDGYVGQNGITNNKKEGDRKTPSGIYGFDIAFGLAENPGTNIIYKQINKNDYWVDDPNSKYYNKWVDIMEVDKDFNGPTHGCVSVDEDTMVKILKILKPYAKIIIAKDRYSISELFK